MLPSMKIALLRCLPLLVLFGCGGGSEALPATTAIPALEPAQYLIVETGILPVILSAPHGGTLEPSGIPIRLQGTTVLDTNTLELVEAIQQRLQVRGGGKATLVAAKVSRKYVDFNRIASEAYENSALVTLYQTYHGALRSAVNNLNTSGKALLVDIHGQSQDVSVVFRGTRNGQTAGLVSLCGSGGFLNALAVEGLALNPNNATDSESPNFNGGHIVATYGKNNADGIHAIQLEFGYTYRENATALNATADRIAAAIITHLQ